MLNKKILLIIFASILFISTIFISGEINPPAENIVQRTATSDTIRTSSGKFQTTFYSGEKNYLDETGKYIPYDLNVKQSNKTGFIYELDTNQVPFKVLIKNNSNTAGAVQFEKDGYFFTYDLSGGAMQWVEQPGFPIRTNTLGSGAPSNSQDSFVTVNSNSFTYPKAYYNTSVKYEIKKDMLKETLILSGLPSIKDYTYLEYTGNIKFNKSLQICTDEKCYIPSGTQDDFSTQGNIYFKDMNNLTIFYLKAPTIEDSAGNTTLGTYKVKGSDAQMQFSLRIPKTFLQTAVYPVYIDPTITYNFSSTYQGINMWAFHGNNRTIQNPDNLIQPLGIDFAEHTTDAALDLSDDSRVTAPSDAGAAGSGYFLFNTSIPIRSTDVTNISWSWEGGITATAAILRGFAWNYTSSSWYNCISQYSGSTSDSVKVCEVLSNSDFISNNISTFLMWMNTSANGKGIRTDYIKLDITYDDLTINSPTNNQEILNTLSTTLNTSQAGYNSTVWYTLNNGRNNNTLCSQSNECQDTITFPRQGYYNLTVYGNKSDGTITSKSVSNLFVGLSTLINVSKDASIYQGQETYTMGNSTGYGSSNYVVGYIVGLGDLYYALIYANFSSIPNNILLKEVSYNAYLQSAFATLPRIEIYLINHNWNEGTGAYEVNTAAINGTTWYERFYENNTNNGNTPFNENDADWQTSGLGSNTDYNSSIIGNMTYDSSSGYKSVNLNTSLISQWFTGGTNYGIILRSQKQEGNTVWTSKEGNVSRVPYFNIIYLSSLNSLAIITNTLLNNSNFTTSNINFTFNISDDIDYLTNISIFIDGLINSTILNPAITANINNSLSFNITGIPEGNHTWYIQAYDSDNAESNSSTLNFLIDKTGPNINIIKPTDYEAFTYATNININYTISDTYSPLSSCWWTNNSGVTNYSITCGNNFTVTEAGDGTYAVTIYANDSLNNIGNKTINYVISADYPAVNLINPTSGLWLNYTRNIRFNFTATDSNGIDTCKLYGNWNGTWILNQTLTSISSGVETNFNLLNLSDGSFLWNVWCNDTTNKGSFHAQNHTINIDTIYPTNITTTEQTTNGDRAFTFYINYTELNPASCKYNFNGLTNLSANCVGSTNAVLPSLAANYDFNVYVLDEAGNENFTTKILNIPSSGIVQGLTGGGGGGATVIIGTGNWSMKTDTGIDKYTLNIAAGESRTKNIIFNNNNVFTVNITLSCDGVLCQYVNLSTKSITLPVGKDIPTSMFFYINLPENVNVSSEIFNIVGTDTYGNKNLITVEVNAGAASQLIKLVAKVGKNTSLFGINFPNIFLIFLPALFLALLLNFTLYKKLKTKVGFTFISFIIAFLIITILLP